MLSLIEFQELEAEMADIAAITKGAADRLNKKHLAESKALNQKDDG